MNCKLFIKGKVCLPAAIILTAALLTFPLSAGAQEPAEAAVPTAPASQPILNVDTGQAGDLSDDPSVEELIGEEDMAAMRDSQAAIQQSTGGMSFHEQLKSKFVEGSAGFMSLVALALVLGLAFCIERIIYLTLSEINAKKLMGDIDQLVERDDVEGAKTLCRNTRGPVASICYQGLMHAHEDMDTVERSIVSYGAVQSGNLEKGCSWIRLFIAMAPSLGFLGTVIGMVMSFDQIQEAGDISPTIVASGMKVALITTIFGIIVALILQVFYNFILSKIEHLTSQMEESAITLLDIIMKQKLRHQSGTGTAQMKA
jgi:biopolymer transport protein ExbB